MIDNTEIMFRLFLAAILGGLIGFERERVSWFAGLRTHMLVCVGSALIIIVSAYGFRDVLQQDLVVLDPSRIAAQVISGIGFLGAGTILFWNKMIRGLTTAASLWTVAAIGLAVGSGLYFASISTVIMILLILAGLKPFERRFFKKQQTTTGIRFISSLGSFSLTSLDQILMNIKSRFGPSHLEIEVDQKQEIYTLSFLYASEDKILDIIQEIKQLPGIEKIEIIE